MIVGYQKNEMWKGAKGRRPQGKTAIHSRAWDVVTAPRRAQEIEMGLGGGVVTFHGGRQRYIHSALN